MCRASFAILAVLAYGAPVAAEAPPAGAWKLIVHHDNPASTVERKAVVDMFTKRRTSWPDNESVHPVDLSSDSPVRAHFSTQVLGRTVAQMRSYWQQRIFSGRELPPLELATDDDVVKFVSSHPGAIGYVSIAADVGGAKVLQIKEP